MTKLAFPTPAAHDPEPPNLDASDIHFEADANGTITAVTVKLGDNDQVIIGIDDGWVRIAEFSRDRLCCREATFVAWALSVLAANEQVRW